MLTDTQNAAITYRYETRYPLQAAESYGRDTIRLLQAVELFDLDVIALYARIACHFAAETMKGDR